MKKVSILGVEVDNLSLEEVKHRINQYIQSGQPNLIVTANPEIIWLARKDKEFAECLREASMITADGIGIVIASRIIGEPIKQRVTGIDLISALFKEGINNNYRFYFLGGKPGIAEKAALNMRENFPGVQIVGVQHGYFNDDSEIVKDIISKKPDVLLVALGMGKQEKWIKDRAIPIGVPVSIGVGGSFDVFSGEVKRAPRWMQKTGLEWFYRLITQPTRIGRMMQLPKFLLVIIMEKLFPRKS